MEPAVHLRSSLWLQSVAAHDATVDVRAAAFLCGSAMMILRRLGALSDSDRNMRQSSNPVKRNDLR